MLQTRVHRRFAFALFAAVILAGCRVLDATLEAEDRCCKQRIASYYLPRGLVELHVMQTDRRLYLAPQERMIRPDTTYGLYTVEYMPSFTSHDNVKVGVDENGLLDLVAVDVDDQIPEIAAKLVEYAVRLSAGLPPTPAGQLDPDEAVPRIVGSIHVDFSQAGWRSRLDTYMRPLTAQFGEVLANECKLNRRRLTKLIELRHIDSNARAAIPALRDRQRVICRALSKLVVPTATAKSFSGDPSAVTGSGVESKCSTDLACAAKLHEFGSRPEIQPTCSQTTGATKGIIYPELREYRISFWDSTGVPNVERRFDLPNRQCLKALDLKRAFAARQHVVVDFDQGLLVRQTELDKESEAMALVDALADSVERVLSILTTTLEGAIDALVPDLPDDTAKSAPGAPDFVGTLNSTLRTDSGS